MFNADQVVAILQRSAAVVSTGRPIVEREVSYMMILFQLLQHVVSADLSALIERVQQFSF